MGRPIKKKLFGNTAAAGNQLEVSFKTSTGTYTGWIVKQLGSRKFRCTDGTHTAVCKLTAGALGVNEMSITATKEDESTYKVVKLTNRKAYGPSGEAYPWSFAAASGDRVSLASA